MNILGIDPGSKKIGYAIININNKKTKVLVAGFIENKKTTFYEGLSFIAKEIKQLFIEYKIDEVASEDIFYSYSPKTVIKLAQFRGAICMSVLEFKDIFFEYTALQVKRAVTGNGKSTKKQVAFIIKNIFNIKEEIKVLDITDAIAIALTHKQRI
jgi:crossover junction endodeoxyribonuclease RuvC